MPEKKVHGMHLSPSSLVRGGEFCSEGHRFLKKKLKLYNPSIKSTFRITNLIYLYREIFEKYIF